MAENQHKSDQSLIGTKSTVERQSVIAIMIHLFHRFVCKMFRFIFLVIYGAHGKSMPSIDDPLLLDSASTLAEKIRTKQVTATKVMNAFIRRTKQINPLLNCVVDERFKDALEEAAEVDRLIASNQFTVDELKERKPFLGVPISTKDAIGVKGMIQTCGIWQRRNERSSEDSDVMHLMRAAGAIPFAITNVPELCMWWETANSIFGRTLNPYDINRIVGGSSGGEGCLQAAAGSPFGIGSDIGGSIRMPAFFNGIFGHLPSPFIVSNRGHWPESTTREEDFALKMGPMSRYACDLKPMLKIIAGDNAKELDLDTAVTLSSLKYFYQYDNGGELFVAPVDKEIQIGLAKVVQHLKTAYNAQPQKVKMDKLKESTPIYLANLTDEKEDLFERQLVNMNGRINPYIELSKWCIRLSKHTLPAILVAIQIRFGNKYGSPKHQLKVHECDELRREFEEMLGDSGVFLYPTHPTVAPYHNEPIINFFNFSYTGIFNMLGLPSTTVPLGLNKDGLPIGIQVVANRNQDRLCLAVASELERAFGGYVAPDIIA